MKGMVHGTRSLKYCVLGFSRLLVLAILNESPELAADEARLAREAEPPLQTPGRLTERRGLACPKGPKYSNIGYLGFLCEES